ncbi:MAG: hypothetical protein ACI3VS_00590 [Evtepia sp.]
MNLSQSDGGTALFFSREELDSLHLSSHGLTQAQALRLVRDALVRARLPIPPAMELTAFPSRQGILFFVLPRLPQAEEERKFSVGFA